MLLRFFFDSNRSNGALKIENEFKESLKQLACIYEPFGHEKDSLEFKLTLNGKVLDSKMVFPIVSQALVEGAVLF